MADVTISEVAFGDARLVKLVSLIQGTYAEAIGFLTLLWHDSQERKKFRATKQDIIEWIRADERRALQVFEALVECRYVVPLSDQEFEIRGNSQRIGVSDSTFTLQPPPEAPPTKRKRAAPKPPAKTESAWLAYSTAYAARYGQEPLRDKLANIHLAQLVEKVGADAAPHVAAFFVSHNKAYYVGQLHPTRLLTADALALHTQWRNNQQMLGTKAQETERRQHNFNSFSGAARRLGIVSG